MNTHADKTPENKSQAIANDFSKKQRGRESPFKFVDNRPEAVAQRKLHEMVYNRPQVLHTRQLQTLSDQSSGLQKFDPRQVTQLKWTFKKKEITKDEADKAAGILGGFAKKLGFDLDFRPFKEAIAVQIEKGADQILDDAIEDPSGHNLIKLYNLVSRRDPITPETAPKVVKKEKKKTTSKKASVKKKEIKSIQDMAEVGLIKGSNNNYTYYWGGTSKVEDTLKSIPPEKKVVKEVDDITGLRSITKGKDVFREKPSPFPYSKEKTLEKEDVVALRELIASFKLELRQSRKLIVDMFYMNKSKKLELKPNQKMIRRALALLEKDLKVYDMTLDEGLDVWESEGMYNILSQVNPEDAVVKILDAMQGVASFEHNPKLERIAQHLANSTDLLESSEWKSARTDEEFNGLIGERLAHEMIANIMPEADEKEIGDEELQLHSVHFFGNIFKDKERYRTDVDVTSELDLMSVIHKKNDTFQYYALGNIKVTKSSAAGEAQTQNDMAEIAINAHINKEIAILDAPKKITCIVKRIVGQEVGTNETIELTGKLKKAGTISKLTVGAHKASGDYDKEMSLSVAEISTLSLILREIEKKKS
jgi:hypothetical protein